MNETPANPANHPDPADVSRALEQALSHVHERPSRWTVLVNDPQRHTRSRVILESLWPHLGDVPARLLVACGTHRFGPVAREAHCRQLLGDRRDVPIAWHDALGQDLVDIGPWRGHPWLLEDGVLLAVGSVEPHYFAGFTGAHKTCTIGCAAHECIEANHAKAMNPACEPCLLEGNPVHEGILAMAHCLTDRRPVQVVNLVQRGPDIIAAVGGTPIEALRPVARIAERAFTQRIPAPADALVLSVPPPLGRSVYQADKALQNNAPAVRDGGVIVLHAALEEGVGQDHFLSLLAASETFREAREAVERNGYRLGDHKAVRLRYLTDPKGRGLRIVVAGGRLDAESLALLGFSQGDATPQATLQTLGIDADDPRVVHVPDAGNTVVRVED